MNAQPITVRKLEVPPTEPLPRNWFYGSAAHTALVDALCLLFPEGERFFIRSVRFYAERLEPELAGRVKGFAAQEAWHGRAHLQVADLLEAQGFEVRQSILERFARLGFGVIEPRFPPHLRLATTAAAEHLTAALAEVALGTPVLDGAAQPMRDLLRWHAVEELEHRAVAFDVLSAVDPRWRTRAGGMAIAMSVLVGFWAMGFRELRAQAKRLPPATTAETWVPPAERRRRPLRTALHLGRAIADYLRPRFHPSQRPLPPAMADWSPGVLNQVQSGAGGVA
ncbi:MAG: metal-dependent hydrolase [Myxococcota bacterium]